MSSVTPIQQNRFEQSGELSGKSITLDGLSKAWGETKALDDVSFGIEAGSFTALLGPSGCGKSTTLRLIAGLEEATAGRIFIGGDEVTGKAPAARDIAMVFQSYALFPHLNIAENIIFGLRVRRTPRAERDAKLKRAADILGLSELLERKPSQLSGGQQQRVALGRAIVAEKSIFLMDEPLSNLDAKLRAEMREEIRLLQRRLGVTMVYVTHDQIEAVTMADKVVLMNHGKVEQIAQPRDMYNCPETLFAAKFIGTPPMAIFAPSALFNTSELDANWRLGIRPEALEPAESGFIKGTVTQVEYLGADTMLECRVGGEEALTCRAPGQTVFVPGEAISLSFNRDDLHAFDLKTGRRAATLPTEFEPLLADQEPASKRGLKPSKAKG